MCFFFKGVQLIVVYPEGLTLESTMAKHPPRGHKNNKRKLLHKKVIEKHKSGMDTRKFLGVHLNHALRSGKSLAAAVSPQKLGMKSLCQLGVSYFSCSSQNHMLHRAQRSQPSTTGAAQGTEPGLHSNTSIMWFYSTLRCSDST